MKTPILLSATRLDRLAAAGGCVIVDCRFDLADTGAGREAYFDGHLPGACYAHLDDDLSSPIGPETGRHPLPTTEDFARFLARIGWQEDRLLVAYDEGAGAFASRLWWLMRFHGQAAAMLDGGIAAWKAAGLPLEAGECRAEPTPVTDLVADESQIVSTANLVAQREAYVVVDARASERFTGAVEPLDTEAGHIPGARNRPFGSNLRLNGRFRDPSELAAEFESLLAGASPERVVHSCGSGVTACHNLFAMELAGIGGSRIYPGSWSEWIRDPSRPIETGP